MSDLAGAEAELTRARDARMRAWQALHAAADELPEAERQAMLDVGMKQMAGAVDFRTLTEHIPDVLSVYDHELRLLFVNPAVYQLGGPPPMALIGKRLDELPLSPASHQLYRTQLRHVLETGETVSLEYREDEAPAGPRSFQTLIVPEHGLDGRVERAIAVTRDISELTAAYQALREAYAGTEREVARQTTALAEQNRVLLEHQALLATMLECLPGALCYHDQDMRFRFVNSRFAAFFSRRPEDFEGRFFHEALPGPHPPSLGVMAGAFLRAAEAGEPYRGFGQPFSFNDEDGRHDTYMDISMTPVRGPDGAVVGVLTLGFDVTPRVELEQEVLRNRAISERMIAHSPVGIAYLDRDFVYRRFNPPMRQFCQRVGLDPDQLLQRTMGVQFPVAEASLEKLRQGEVRHLRGHAVQHCQRREDTTYWDLTLVPVMEGGSFEGLLILAAEATERVAHERMQEAQIRKLQELDRLKRDFLNAASHELRTPLTAIEGYAEFLEDEIEGPLSEGQRAFVTQIQEGSTRLKRIVNDLLDFAKLEAGTFELVPREVDLVRVVRDELAMLVPLAREAAVALESELPEGPLPMRVDPARIGQVVSNLAGNALKFTPAGGQVRVRVAAELAGVRVEVADTGIGIPAESQAQVFEKFYQVDRSTTRAHGGAGLGLSIAKSLVERHGGAIGMSSVPGAGSTFWFTLPAG